MNTVWLNLSRSDQIKNTVDPNVQEDTHSLKILKRLEELFMTIDERKVDCQDCIGIDIKERLRKPKKKDDAIKAVNHMARASGMSYGKFVAQMSMEPLERK